MAVSLSDHDAVSISFEARLPVAPGRAMYAGRNVAAE
jgi:hypothetical protein